MSEAQYLKDSNARLIRRIAELEAAVLAEREACASQLEALADEMIADHMGVHASVYRHCAAAIRERPAP